MPGPSSVTTRRRPSVGFDDRDGDAAGGVLDSVADQVVDHAPERDRVAQGERVRIGRARHRHPGLGVAVGDVGGQLTEIDRLHEPELRIALVGPGEQQKVVDEPAETSDVGHQVVGQRCLVQALGDLQLRAQARDRAAQLVRGIRDECLLPGAGGVQPVEHVVQRHG